MDKAREQKLAKNIGRAISDKRKQAKLSQESVAEILGIGYEAISRMERGVIVPSITRLIELSEIFDCGINDLISGSADTSIEMAGNIAQKLPLLTPHQRTIILDVLNTLIEGFNTEK